MQNLNIQSRFASPANTAPAAAARAQFLKGGDTARNVGQAAPAESAALTQWLINSLDAMDYGVLMLTEQGRLLYSNQAGREALASGGPLSCQDEQVLAERERDELVLADALTAAATRGLRRLLCIGSGTQALSVAVLPLELSGGLPSGACLMLLSRPEACPQLSLQWFASAHGLTPAESRVMQALAQGNEPREIASSFDVGLATVRTQIGSIRSKVGADSIRELLRQLGTLPPMLSALRGLC